jgi:hypothetical protein
VAERGVFLVTMSMPALEPTHPPIEWVLREIFAGVKWPEYKGDYMFPSSASDKNATVLHTFPVHCMAHGQCIPYQLLPLSD